MTTRKLDIVEEPGSGHPYCVLVDGQVDGWLASLEDAEALARIFREARRNAAVPDCRLATQPCSAADCASTMERRTAHDCPLRRRPDQPQGTRRTRGERHARRPSGAAQPQTSHSEWKQLAAWLAELWPRNEYTAIVTEAWRQDRPPQE